MMQPLKHNIMKNSVRNSVLQAVAKTVKGTSFVGIRNYENKQGEISNQTILVGINFENVLKHDFQVLKEKQKDLFLELEKKHSKELIIEAYKKVYDSLEKRLSDETIKEKLRLEGDSTILASDAQIDAFNHIAKGVKLHKETEQLHIFGLVVKKTIINPIEYQTVNSRELTIVQNKIKKFCGFKQDKYRTLIFDKATIKLQGIQI
jgi:hypothetical protein